MKPSCLTAFMVLFLSSNVVSASSRLPEATLASGIAIGTTTSLPSAAATVNKFLGITFAALPPERFSPPTWPKAWATPLNASAWRPVCVQQFSYSHNPPFRAAIEESGEVFLEGFLNAGLNSTQSWLALVASLNCSQSTSNLACVRAANATTVKSIIEHAALGFQPSGG
jgi:hypothetical protein